MTETFNAKAFDYYPPLNKVRRHFETNYSQPMFLSDAARIAGLERKHFGKFFKREVGIGFKEWTTRIRIQLAIDAIQKQHQPLTDVAFAVGFQDFRTFERAFTRQTALTPLEFRKRMVSKNMSKNSRFLPHNSRLLPREGG
jgi:two-component system response regulator YesN